MDTCIYCPQPIYEGKRSREHVLSAGFGSFRDAPFLLDRVCRRCNHEIGKAEEQLLRSSPIGLFRVIADVEGRDRKQPSPFYRGSAGSPPLLTLGTPPDRDYPILWEVHRGTTNVSPLRQVVLRLQDGQIELIPVPDTMRTSNGFTQVVRQRGIENFEVVECFTKGPDEWSWLSQMLSPHVDPQRAEHQHLTWPKGKIELGTRFQVDKRFFRAVAKIGFHYVLSQLSTLTGHEPQFEAIRHFIRYGEGEPDDFVLEHLRQFVGTFREGLAPSDWTHLLYLEKTSDSITGRCQFFLGPTLLPPHYEIHVGDNPSGLMHHRQIEAHFFKYEVGLADGHSGVCISAPINKLVIAAKPLLLVPGEHGSTVFQLSQDPRTPQSRRRL